MKTIRVTLFPSLVALGVGLICGSFNGQHQRVAASEARGIKISTQGNQPCSPKSRIGIMVEPAFVIKAVTKRSPADRRGIAQDDVISAINGRQLPDQMSFEAEIWSSFPGTQFEVTYLRGNPGNGNMDEQKAIVQSKAVKDAAPGGTVHPRSNLGVIGVYGLVTRVVDAVSPAAQTGLRVGDVLTGLNGNALTSVSDFQDPIHSSDSGTIFQITYLRYDASTRTLVESQVSVPTWSISRLFVSSTSTSQDNVSPQGGTCSPCCEFWSMDYGCSVGSHYTGKSHCTESPTGACKYFGCA
jgi:C-terminal processing protease CtpA/Prc